MTIYIGTGGLPNNVLRDLALIVTADVGLEVDTNPSQLPAGLSAGQAVQVRYDQTIASPIHDRIFDIISDHSYDVVIGGLRSNDRVPAAGNQEVWQIGGFTFQSPLGPIVIFYDALQCNGEGVWVMGLNGQPIDAFTTDGLFHELSHAFHFGIGDNVNPIVDESVAINEENILRHFFGMPLRDPSNHNGGCNRTRPGMPAQPNAPDEPTNTETSNFGKVECFIASAAYGDGNANEVNRLRYMRDRYLRRTTIGERLFAEFSREYYQFSPEIARVMHENAQFKTTITYCLVRPLFAFLSMADAMLTHGAESDQLGKIIETCAARFRNCSESGLGKYGKTIEWIHLKAIVQTLVRSLAVADAEHILDLPTARNPQEKTAIAHLQWLAGRIRSAIGPDSYLLWMLGEPISLAWDFIAACRRLVDDEVLKRQVTQAVRNWMQRLPWPALAQELPEDTLKSDFEMLRGVMFSDPVIYRNARSQLNDMVKANER